MAEIPNLAGIATQDLVETIGSGRFQASYINWSRTLNLLRTHAPGWIANCITNDNGSLLHVAPVGAYLMIQFVHSDGTETPAVPQAVMDNRNNAIPYEKITARDITDTQRRGTCMAAAFTFGLAFELWAKMPMESGYGDSAPDSAPKSTGKTLKTPTKGTVEAVKGSEPAPNETDFREVALAAGLSTHAIEGVLPKVKGDFAKGIKAIKDKSQDDIKALNLQFAPKESSPAMSAKDY